MSRFTDPLLFGALFAISAIAWWLLELNGQIPAVSGGAMAPMTVAVVVVIATPAMLFVTTIAMVRSLLNVRPRVFWAWMTGATALAALLIEAANLVTSTQQVEVGFSTGVWLMAIASLASLIALILALTGAIPTAHETVVENETENGGSSYSNSFASRRPGEPHFLPGDESSPVADVPSSLPTTAEVLEPKRSSPVGDDIADI